MIKQSSSDILLVPSAVLVPDELRLDVGSIPAGMIPLQGHPMLERLSEAYESIDVTKVVAVSESASDIQDYVERSSYDWTIIDVGTTNSVGQTVLRTLQQLPAETIDGSRLYVNFADTLISPILQINGQDYISYSFEDRSYRWTTFDVVHGTIDSITQKYNSDNDVASPTFVGQFGIADTCKFKYALQSAVETSVNRPDVFYEALLAYLSNREYTLYEPDSWLDVGHLDTYHRAKKEFLNTREFNELEIDEQNVITKRSVDTSTLINEINWYNEIPNQLQPYLPRLYEWSTDIQDPYVKLEYIGYPSLSDLQLYGSHGHHIWDGVFHRLFDMLDDFRQFQVDAKEYNIRNSLEEIYLSKTRRRLNNLYKSGNLTEMFEADLVQINGVSYPSVGYILDQLDEIVDSSGLIDQQQFSIIHGDLCFPNILYDPRNEILKLIDPRGEFGQFTVYGDQHYDIAKLRHSVVGHYEHLINGQFNASFDPDSASINYDIYTTNEQTDRESRFDSLLESRDGFDLEMAKLIEGLLFLSMVPLHADSTTRQQCMIAQGIEKTSPFLA